MDKITEIIIVPNYAKLQTLETLLVMEKLRSKLGKFNLIENEFTNRAPVLLFNGTLSKEAYNKCAELAITYGYAVIRFTVYKEELFFNNESLK